MKQLEPLFQPGDLVKHKNGGFEVGLVLRTRIYDEYSFVHLVFIFHSYLYDKTELGIHRRWEYGDWSLEKI